MENERRAKRWTGIEKINEILDDITTQINHLKQGTMRELDDSISLMGYNKGIFLPAMDETVCKFLKNSS